MNSFWRKVYTKDVSNVDFDYEVVMKIQNVVVTPERIKEVEYLDRKEIKDGFQYVLDENGNVMKDSLGNDIKVDRFVWVEASVLETFQHKAVDVNISLEFVNLKNANRVSRKSLGAGAVFEHYASTYRGDRRALSERSIRYCDNRPQPFPPTELMLIQAAEDLKPVVKTEINRSRLL